MARQQVKICLWVCVKSWRNLSALDKAKGSNQRRRSKSMIGKKTDFRGRIRRETGNQNSEFYMELHCIIHQQTHCENTDVWTWYGSCGVGCELHSISWTSLSPVSILLSENDAEYRNGLYRWLSHGALLKRFLAVGWKYKHSWMRKETVRKG